jgi:hypothetical protein
VGVTMWGVLEERSPCGIIECLAVNGVVVVGQVVGGVRDGRVCVEVSFGVDVR